MSIDPDRYNADAAFRLDSARALIEQADRLPHGSVARHHLYARADGLIAHARALLRRRGYP